jgi:hypothetical protein
MQKISEYRAHAQEWLLAQQMADPEQRRRLEEIART